MSPADSIDSSKFVSTTNYFATRPDDWSLATRVAIASVTSQGTMGGLIVAGFVSNIIYIQFLKNLEMNKYDCI